MSQLKIAKFPLSKFWVATFIIMGAIYGFGVFGLLNLFDFRNTFQFIYIFISLSLSILIYLNRNLPKNGVLISLIFFFTLAFGELVLTGRFNVFIEILIILNSLAVIFLLSDREIIKVARILIIVTTILSLLVLTGFLYYVINPDQFVNANFNIYDSSTGGNSLSPHNFIDWISFTSGDGHTLFGKHIPRMKGYPNEPSSSMFIIWRQLLLRSCLENVFSIMEYLF